MPKEKKVVAILGLILFAGTLLVDANARRSPQSTTPPQVSPVILAPLPLAPVAGDSAAMATDTGNLLQQAQGNFNSLGTQGNQLVAAVQDLQARMAAAEAKLATMPVTTTKPVIHVESESFTVATPACTNANGCIQNTSDTAPPAVGSLKVVLTQGMALDYMVTATIAGNYTLTVRLNGIESVHFETPAGTPVSGAIVNAQGNLGTFTAPNPIPLLQASQTVRMVVDSVGAGVPSANWFELTKQ